MEGVVGLKNRLPSCEKNRELELAYWCMLARKKVPEGK
jgi:hypothetical protein